MMGPLSLGLILLELLMVSLMARSPIPILAVGSALLIAIPGRTAKPMRILLTIFAAVLLAGSVALCLIELNRVVRALIVVMYLQTLCLGGMASAMARGRRSSTNTAAGLGLALTFLSLVPAYLFISQGGGSLLARVTQTLSILMIVMAAINLDAISMVMKWQRGGRQLTAWRACILLCLISGTLMISSRASDHLAVLAQGIHDSIDELANRNREDDTALSAPSAVRPRQTPVNQRFTNPHGLELENQYDIDLPHIPEVYLTFKDLPAPSARQDGLMYLRTVAFDSFSGQRWYVDDQDVRIRTDADDGSEDGRIHIGDRAATVDYTVYMRFAPGGLLPVIPNPVRFDIPEIRSLDHDVYSLPMAPLSYNYRYSAASAPQIWPLTGNLIVQADSPGRLYQRYNLSGSELTGILDTMAADILGDATDDREKLGRLLRHFHFRYDYSLKTENQNDAHPLVHFLTNSREGHCELFASATVLMLRAAGFSSRLAVGYCGGSLDEKEKLMVYFSDDAHAWAEVYLEDIGWVVFDTTPPSEHSPAAPSPATAGPDSTDALKRFPPVTDLFEGEIALTDPTDQPSWADRFLASLEPEIAMNAFLLLAGLIAIAMIRRRAGTLTGCEPAPAALPPPAALQRLFDTRYADETNRRKPAQTGLEYLGELRHAGIDDPDMTRAHRYLYQVAYHGKPRSEQEEKVLAQALQKPRRSQ